MNRLFIKVGDEISEVMLFHIFGANTIPGPNVDPMVSIDYVLK